MSLLRFAWPTIAEARAVLRVETRQAEFYADRLIALHRLQPKTTAAERAASTAFVLGPSHSCTRCGQHLFPAPTLCFWCRRSGADAPTS